MQLIRSVRKAPAAKTRLNVVREKYDGLINAYGNMTEESSEIEKEIEVLSDRFFKLYDTISDLCEERKPKLEVPISRETTLNVKLPDIKLPTFGGDFLKWPQFRNSFIALISNNSALPNINKFYTFVHHFKVKRRLYWKLCQLLKIIMILHGSY